MPTNAQNQAAYRSRQRQSDAKRLCVFISKQTANTLIALAIKRSLTQRAVIETLINDAGSSLLKQEQK